MSEQTKFDIVQKTSFEEFAAKVEDENKLRNRHIEILERIMKAYSYVRCVWSSNLRALTSDEVNAINNFIDTVIAEKNEKTKSGLKNYEPAFTKDWYQDSYLWAYCGYYKWADGAKAQRNAKEDNLIDKSSYWQSFRENKPESQKPLTGYRLQEDLWDSEKGGIKYYRLPEFVENYPWAFPPNVVELHREMVARELEDL